MPVTSYYWPTQNEPWKAEWEKLLLYWDGAPDRLSTGTTFGVPPVMLMYRTCAM